MKDFFDSKYYVNLLNGLHIPLFFAVIALFFNFVEAKGATPESILLYTSPFVAFFVAWLFNVGQKVLTKHKQSGVTALKESLYSGFGGIFGGLLSLWLYNIDTGYWILAPAIAILAFTYYLWKK